MQDTDDDPTQITHDHPVPAPFALGFGFLLVVQYSENTGIIDFPFRTAETATALTLSFCWHALRR
jgi:hypothetical protein